MPAARLAVAPDRRCDLSRRVPRVLVGSLRRARLLLPWCDADAVSRQSASLSEGRRPCGSAAAPRQAAPHPVASDHGGALRAALSAPARRSTPRSFMGAAPMSKYGECETCGEVGELVDGMCAACRSRYGIVDQWMTRERMLEVLSQHIGAKNGVTISQLVNQMAHPRTIDSRERASIERNAREL